VWFVAGILSLLGALTYGELGRAKPDAGGLYAYIRDAFGPLPAFLYGGRRSSSSARAPWPRSPSRSRRTCAS
jgi:amino acid transporter